MAMVRRNIPASLCLTVTLMFKPDTSLHGHAVTIIMSLIQSDGVTSVQAGYVTTWPCCDNNYVPYPV